MITAIVCLIVGACIGAIGMGILAGSNNRDCDTCDALKSSQADCEALKEQLATSQRSCNQFRAANTRLHGKLWYHNHVGIAR